MIVTNTHRPPPGNALPYSTWPAAVILCGAALWGQSALYTVPSAPHYALALGVGLTLVHWWGLRVVACYLFAAVGLQITTGITPGDNTLGHPLLASATLVTSYALFRLRRQGLCWFPNLKQAMGFLVWGLFLPYAVVQTAATLLTMQWSPRSMDTVNLFAQVQSDLFSMGGAFFCVTLPSLALLTHAMERRGWAHARGSTSPQLFEEKQGKPHPPRQERLLFFTCLLLIPIVIPFSTGWYVALALPLWAALSFTPPVVILSMAWILPAGSVAALLMPTPQAVDPTTAAIGTMSMGVVALLLAVSRKDRRAASAKRPQVNAELKEGINTLIHAFLSSPEATLVSRFSDGKVVDANPVIKDLIGYSRDEIMDIEIETKNLWVNPDHRKNLLEALSASGGVQAFETEFRHKSGEVLPCIISARQFPLNGEMCIISSVRLNRASKKMEQELERNRVLYSEAQKIAHLGHWELNIRTGELLWSDEIYNIFEISAVTHAPSYALFLNLIHPDDRKSVRDAFNASVANHTPYATSHRLQMPNGDIKYIDEKGHTEYDDTGSPLRTIGTVQDVTPYKKMEMEKEKALAQLRQSQKLESVGTLAGGIAHDFNNILSAILGYAEISLDPPPEEPQLHENILQIHDAGNRARDLVRQLLTFCKKAEQIKEPMTINPIIKETLKFLRASLPATIRIDEALTSEATIIGDATQIHQVIMNLCTNAASAMKSSGGVLSIELTRVDIDDAFSQRFIDMPTGEHVKLLVGDTGHGMDAETQRRIFDPFFTTKKEGEGSGLGLSVVHGIVTSHNGQILVSSEPGRGTLFTLYFPTVEDMVSSVVKTEVPLPRGTERLLVVDDEQPLVELMRLMLTAMGYEVVTTTSPIEALELFQQDPDGFHALMTDLTMPGMTGVELTEKVRAIRHQFPVILCSGFADSLNQTISNPSLRIMTLLKPLNRQTIATTLRQILDA